MGWGDAIITQLERDLEREIPDLEGFFRRNPYRKRSLYLAHREQGESVPQLVAQISWGHNTVLLEKVKDPLELQSELLTVEQLQQVLGSTESEDVGE